MAGSIMAVIVSGLVGASMLATTSAHAGPDSGLTRASVDEVAHVRGLTADYVRTPYGYFHASCVQRIDQSESLLSNGSIQRADGSVRSVAGCRYPHFLRSGVRVEASEGTTHMPAAYNGYLQLVSTTLSSAASRLDAKMRVPPNPTVQSGQTIYLFPGLEDAVNDVTILQPVLGWNGYGANNWTIASWNCCKSGTIYVGNNVVVRPSDLIQGSVVHNVGWGWTITATDQTRATLPAAILKTSSFGQNLNWVFAAALETYGVTSCAQFPRTSPAKFTDIQVYLGGGAVTNPIWTIQPGTDPETACTGARIVSPSAVNIRY